MIVGSYADPASYYEAAAEYCATHGFSDIRLVRAWLTLPDFTLEEIEANPHEWERRVNEYAYGLRSINHE